MRSYTEGLAVLFLVLGCEGNTSSTASEPTAVPAAEPAQAVEAPPSSQPAPAGPAAPAAAGAEPSGQPNERAFGAALSAAGEPVAVADILRDPKPFLGKTVKTSGVVARVCERAGCWLELKPAAGEGGLRVPMADHAFVIPQDALGRPAIVEGELSAQSLSPSHKEHLEGEGAQAVGPLALSARAVLIR